MGRARARTSRSGGKASGRDQYWNPKGQTQGEAGHCALPLGQPARATLHSWGDKLPISLWSRWWIRGSQGPKELERQPCRPSSWGPDLGEGRKEREAKRWRMGKQKTPCCVTLSPWTFLWPGRGPDGTCCPYGEGWEQQPERQERGHHTPQHSRPRVRACVGLFLSRPGHGQMRRSRSLVHRAHLAQVCSVASWTVSGSGSHSWT